MVADLETSAFLVVANVVAAVFLATAAAGGRLLSFLRVAVALLGCAAVTLPEEGAVAALEAEDLAVEGGFVMAAAVEGLAAGREVGAEAAVAGLEVFVGAAESGFVEEVPGLGTVGPVGRLSGTVVLGLVAASFFFGVQFAGLVPLVTAAAAAAGPVGFLSGILT